MNEQPSASFERRNISLVSLSDFRKNCSMYLDGIIYCPDDDVRKRILVTVHERPSAFFELLNNVIITYLQPTINLEAIPTFPRTKAREALSDIVRRAGYVSPCEPRAYTKITSRGRADIIVLPPKEVTFL